MIRSVAEGGKRAERYHVPILIRALRILEELAQHAEGCTTGDLVDGLDIPHNTVYRILSTLSDYGYIRRNEKTKTYRLERKLLGLAYTSMGESGLVENSMDVMRELRDEVGETVLLAVRIGNEGVVIEQTPGLQPVKVTVQIGHRFPMHTSAPGKALLAWLPESELNPILNALSYERYTERTISDADAFREELSRARQLGYTLDCGEEIENLHCVGAPILNHSGTPLAAIWVTGMASALPESFFPSLGEQVRTAADRISGRFGYIPKSG